MKVLAKSILMGIEFENLNFNSAKSAPRPHPANGISVVPFLSAKEKIKFGLLTI